MPIVINSPYSGRPIKVRDQDIGRAIRDENGRIFYVVQRRDAGGFYAAPTRHGSVKDEQNYLDLLANPTLDQEQAAPGISSLRMHDATGRARTGRRWLALWIGLIGGLAAVFYLIVWADLAPWGSEWDEWLRDAAKRLTG